MHGGPITDRFRGLVISPEQCSALLKDGPAASWAGIDPGRTSPLWSNDQDTWARRLSSAFNFDQTDLDILLIAVASEFDLRYERLFAYLQDDVTRKRPTVDLILNLLCADDDARFTVRGRFASDAPLVRSGLIHLVTDPGVMHPPLLAQFIGPDEHLVRWLLGAGGLHADLVSWCTRDGNPQVDLEALALPIEMQSELQRIADGIGKRAAVPPIWLHSPAGDGAADAARFVSHTARTSLLHCDATRVPPADAERLLRLAMREAWMGGDVLCVDHADAWLGEPSAATRLAVVLREPRCSVLIGATRAVPAELLGVVLPMVRTKPDITQRHRCWVSALTRHGVTCAEDDLKALAARFRLTSTQITAAVADAAIRTPGAVSVARLNAAARAQSGEALALVADKVNAKATWDDIILPADAVAQLHELCTRIEQHDRVFNDWGFGRKLSRGRGTAALFSGGSGTGKTMAAEVIANALGLDLYRIDLARVVNKYIGETEKNLDRVFDAAESANAILFFDEADALFGKRSEVKDAHDRYANIEVSYLLQKMEEYDGIAILASNLADNLDDAFTRRLAFHIYFPFPDEAGRVEIWRRAWPSAAQVALSLDRKSLARELKLAGGSIKNIALGAAFSAAANGGVIDETHVAHAVQREYEKAGRGSTIPTRFMRVLPSAPPRS